MTNENIEGCGNLFNRYTEISTNLNDNQKKPLIESKNKSNNISISKSHNDEIMTSFGDFVLMMDNKEEYRKEVINSEKKK